MLLPLQLHMCNGKLFVLTLRYKQCRGIDSGGIAPRINLHIR